MNKNKLNEGKDASIYLFSISPWQTAHIRAGRIDRTRLPMEMAKKTALTIRSSSMVWNSHAYATRWLPSPLPLWSKEIWTTISGPVVSGWTR